MNAIDSLLGPKKSQRDALGEALAQIGRENPDVFVLSPDVGTSTKAITFKRHFPDRYVCTGIAEMNTVGIAAGLSNIGYTPIVAGYAMFVAGKAWEPFRNSVAYPHLNVKLIGTHAGINVGPDGVTHQAIEDIALMRAIPGVEILTPSDAEFVLPALHHALESDGPVYIRLEREPMPVLIKDDDWSAYPDYIPIFSEGKIAIMAIGGMVSSAIEAANYIRMEYEVDTQVICVNIVKPTNIKKLLEVTKDLEGVVTAEDHNVIGGFGSSISEFVAQNCPMPLEMIGIHDEFACSDDCSELKKCCGLTTEAIVQAVLKIRNRLDRL